MAEKFVFVREFEIPDDSSHDGVAPAMWGSYLGGGKLHRFFCQDCSMFLNVRFPRWDRILQKVREPEEVMERKFKCPSCIKDNFIKIEVETDE